VFPTVICALNVRVCTKSTGADPPCQILETEGAVTEYDREPLF